MTAPLTVDMTGVDTLLINGPVTVLIYPAHDEVLLAAYRQLAYTFTTLADQLEQQGEQSDDNAPTRGGR